MHDVFEKSKKHRNDAAAVEAYKVSKNASDSNLVHAMLVPFHAHAHDARHKRRPLRKRRGEMDVRSRNAATKAESTASKPVVSVWTQLQRGPRQLTGSKGTENTLSCGC